MTARTIPEGLASLLQLLELEQPKVVTTLQLAAWSSEAGVTWPGDVVVRRLRERGWLLDLATRGVWEFIPAARAGAYGSGDPLVELRATLARNPSSAYVVAAESAAYLLGLASRGPEREVVGVPEHARSPKAFRGFRIVRWSLRTAPVHRLGLPVWSQAVLLAFMATRPSGYQDWPNVGEWLVQAVAQMETDGLKLELTGCPRGAWARAAYLVDRGGRPDVARSLLLAAPPGSGPYYLGDRRGEAGRYSRDFDVIDSIGLEVEGA
jgi:hypothetical protein